MNSRTLLSLTLMMLATNLFGIDTTHDLKKVEITFNKILNGLDSVLNNSTTHNQIVEQHYKFVKDKITKGALEISYDSTLNNDFYGCASFNVHKENYQKADISIGKFVIENHEKHPALVYAIMISTFQNAYDYFNNNELFIIGLKNPIERLYFEIDALAIEAMFLDTYMKNSKTLGYVEKYLIADLPQNLNGSSTLFRQTDLNLLHKIDALKSTDKSAIALLKEFNEIGKDLINTIKLDNESKWVNYCSIITLRTYTYYSKQVIFDILYSKNGIDQASFKLDDYPENLATIHNIQKIIDTYKDILAYHQETIKLFADSYKK